MPASTAAAAAAVAPVIKNATKLKKENQVRKELSGYLFLLIQTLEPRTRPSTWPRIGWLISALARKSIGSEPKMIYIKLSRSTSCCSLLAVVLRSGFHAFVLSGGFEP